jgi:hypothetical protein
MRVVNSTLTPEGQKVFQLNNGYVVYLDGSVLSPSGRGVKPESGLYKRIMVSVEVYKSKKQ